MDHGRKRFRLRRLFRFSMSMLLFALTLLCVSIGIVSQRAKNQQNVVRLVSQAKGTVHYAHEAKKWPEHSNEFSSDLTFDTSKTPAGPAWLQHKLGTDYFSKAVKVDLEDRQPDCANLTKALSTNSNIIWLNLAATGLTDSDLSEISSMKQLTVLRVGRNPKLTDEGLAKITTLVKLERLDAGLIDSLNGSFLENANRMTKLRELDLQDTSLDGDNFRFLKFHPSIFRLTLAKTNIENDDLQFLKTMPQLKLLSINDTLITENGMKYIAENLELLHLYIGGQNVTDDWVPHLAKMKSLEYLAIWDSAISDGSFSTLQKSLPKCMVDRK